VRFNVPEQFKDGSAVRQQAHKHERWKSARLVEASE
jgi:hypothetical protein